MIGHNLQIIKKILWLSAEISFEDRDGLFQIFSKLRDVELEDVVALLTEKPEWLARLAENYRAKLEAFENQDAALWNWIINGEIAALKALEA